jgi:hypothetical protein
VLFEYANYPQEFFTPHHLRRNCNNVILGGGHCFALHHSCTHVMPYSHVLGQSCTNLIVKHCCAFMSFNNVFRQLLLECPIVAQQLAPSEPTVALRVPTTQRRNCNPTVSTILKKRRFKLLRLKKNLYRVVW